MFYGNDLPNGVQTQSATLVEFLFRDHTFPHGCFLLTGTAIVPPDEFYLRARDEIRSSIDGIGTLTNRVA